MYRLLSAILLCVILTVSSGSKPKRNKDFTHSSRKEFCNALSGEWKSVKSSTRLFFGIPFNDAMDSGFVGINTTPDPLDETTISFALDSSRFSSDGITDWLLSFRSDAGSLYIAVIMKLNKDTLQIYDREQYLHGTYLRRKK